MVKQSTYDDFDTFTSLLGGVKRAVLSTHINPDCDGLGSQVALSSFLRSKGIDTLVLNHQPVPAPFRFLDPSGEVLLQFDPSRHAALVQEADLYIVVDTNHPDRLGSLADHLRKSKATKVIIDHHLEPDGFADVVIADDGSCATGEIVYRYLEHVGALPPDALVASALYAAIMTDTGSFRFPKTDSDVHRITANLIDAGANPSEVYANVYEQGKPNRLQLLGRVLSTLEMHSDGRVCLLTVTRDMFESTGATELDTDMFVTYGLTISGATVSVMVSELTDIVKINVRSKGTIPANEIARVFGGNGHLNAAGARIEGTSVAALVPKILEVTEKYLNKD